VQPGAPLSHIQSELGLSEEATAEAEPVLTVAIGLAIPGRRG
jgi:hypothetical protein